jgi:cytochrome c oxidase subunit 3/cytochrome o ubiquinol oxidase subunit 3
MTGNFADNQERTLASAGAADGVLTPSGDLAAALSPVQVGMLAFIASEAAFFATLIMTYLFFLRETLHGDPKPSEVFHMPMVLAASACLFSSSATIYAAERSLRQKARRAFLSWWGLTIVLAVLFLLGTGLEWRELIFRSGLTISRNLFGTTYFTLVGFHALHVTVGVVVMAIIFGLAWRRQITEQNETGVQVVSWYWHFVDAVWAVVFALVYIIGR